MTLRGLVVVFVATSAAWAQVPQKSESLTQLRARALSEAIAEVTAAREGGCLRLHEALLPFWGAENLLEWPRVMRTPLPTSVTGVKAAADACVATAFSADGDSEWSLARVLISPVLQDGALWKEAVERGLAAKELARKPNGSLERLRRGGGSGGLGGVSFRPRSIDSAEASPRVSGPLDADLVRQVIRNNRGQAGHCYEASAAFRRAAKGKVVVQFSITPAGTTERLALEDTTLDEPALEACILERIATWRFPKPRGGPVTVSYPFELAPAP